ncbi:hypothetical protein BCR39DRAFT_509164 [Naematelia encephala]|uniref:Uncharacterized protein n=1 Tax=Naematelia encephala TaxID=71784 RepID=A0A1Y2BL55_9TREE|nr:hypothetical protein BCR39DRAFT_509164 [Naematelia encephala]
MIDLLEAQRDELFDLRGYAEGHGIPTLETLSDIYTKVSSALSAVQFASHSTSISTLQTLLQVLTEGPDYLIDVTIIEAIIWQAEVIDSQFGSEVREVLDNAVAEQNNLVTFRRAAESIIAIASALPRDELDDAFAREAYRAIGLLVKQLQARVDSTRRGTPASSDHLVSMPHGPVIESPAYSQTPSPIDSPISSPIVSPTVSDNDSDSDTNYEALDTESLQRRYGTGIKSPSSRPTSYSHSPSPASSDSESVWEYKGHLVTRSALELLLVQEEQKKLLAHADSSGQWSGEVTWDDLRSAWIPRWTEKLRPEDLAEGEVPSTNPADFKVKEKDQWGNKIEWKNGRMFYVEEGDPTFELPE